MAVLEHHDSVQPSGPDCAQPLEMSGCWLQLCLDKGLATEEALREGVETLESKASLNLGAKLTALAWTDTAFKVGH